MTSDRPGAVDGAALQARVGTVVKGKWTLVRLMGVGGMAAVYEARHEIGRRDALKILHADVAEDAELVERFRREAHAANKLTHPAVVEVRDADVTEEGLPFLVMELIEGESVARRLRRSKKLPEDEAVDLVLQLLDVLIAAHDRDVVHRDIKPSNLMIDERGKLRVLDFGVARIKHASGKPLTQAGTTLGTVGYMPPEQLRGSDVDARADLYAVGATLFEMLAGRPVHEAESEEELARVILKEPAPPLADVASDVRREVCMVVDRALAHVKARRYPDAKTMRDDLRAAREGEPPPYATEWLEGGDDPRDREPPKEERRERATARIVAAKEGDAPQPVADTIVDGEPGTEVDDDAPTKPRRGGTEVMAAQPDEKPAAEKTAADKPAVTVVPAAAPPPQAAPRPELQKSAGIGVLGWAAAVIAALALVVIWVGVGADTPGLMLEPLPPLPSLPPPPATPEPAVTAPEPEASVEPESSAVPKPGPRVERDGGLPFPLPSGLPSGFPTGFPTALPSIFPSALPPVPSASTKPP